MNYAAYYENLLTLFKPRKNENNEYVLGNLLCSELFVQLVNYFEYKLMSPKTNN